MLSLMQQIVLKKMDDGIDVEAKVISWSPKIQIGGNKPNQSNYLGVSTNGDSGWQVMCMVDGRQ